VGAAIRERFQLDAAANPEPQPPAQPLALEVLGVLTGITLSWSISGIPVYVRRRRMA